MKTISLSQLTPEESEQVRLIYGAEHVTNLDTGEEEVLVENQALLDSSGLTFVL